MMNYKGTSRTSFVWLALWLWPSFLPAAQEHGGQSGGDDVNIFGGDLFLSVLTIGVFLTLLVILGKWAWKPILTGLQKREEYIRQSLDDAQKAKNEGLVALAQYKQQLDQAKEQSREIMEQGYKEAMKLADEIRQEVQAEAEKIHQQAQRDIAAAKDRALQEIYEQSSQLAVEIARTLIQKNLTVEDHQKLLQQSLKTIARQQEASSGDGEE